MSLRLPGCVEVCLQDDEHQRLVAKAKDWAIMHGISMRSKSNFSFDTVNIAPFMLLPSTFPRKEFEKARNLQPLFNELVVKIAANTDFLANALEGATTVDTFTERLYKIFRTVKNEGTLQEECCCGLLRCDYMLDKESIKQVEINTIASSFGGITTQVPHLHRLTLQDLGHADKCTNLPDNKAVEGLCQGLIEAWEIYSQPSAIILFVVEEVTFNICDQRFHEFEIKKQNPNISILRKTLTELGSHDVASLNPQRKLLVEGKEVAVVYFRAGYAPDHYPSADDTEWNARLMIERSTAIKCPNITFHLTGTKKVQQVLAEPGVLEQLVNDSSKADLMKQVFTGLYALDLDEAGDRAVEMALENPQNFVLKPQREGGGNNVYGAEVADALKKMGSSPERAAYILMDIIKPPVQTNCMIRAHTPPIFADTTSELGIYGVVISKGGTILRNSTAGHVLRTKLHSSNEGGVAAGQGALDSPFLVDM